MIVDCHTHIWESPGQIGLTDQRLQPDRLEAAGMATPQRHTEAAKPVDVSFVLGFASDYLGARVPNQLIASYVRQAPDQLIGFAGIDPTHPAGARDELRRATEEFGFKGVVVTPAAQNIHPADTRAMQLYEQAAMLGLPLIFDASTHCLPGGRLAYAQPVLLDEVACEFPDLRIVIGHMGYPWIDEAVVVMAKNANVYADVAGLMQKPWQAYNALLSAYRLGVIDKLLFGSDFPFGSATTVVEAFYGLNQISHGTNLPNIPREQLRAVVEQDALALLGIERPTGHTPAESD